MVQTFSILCSITHPWVGTDTAVEGGVVASNGTGVDEWLCELWCLLEVMVIILWDFHLHACWGKGKGMGFCMILTLSGIMWGFVCDEGKTMFFYSSVSKTNTPSSKSLSVIPPTHGIFEGGNHY